MEEESENKNKGKGNGAGLVQTCSLFHKHTLLVQTHNMTTVKDIAEQCRQLYRVSHIKSD